MTFDPAPEIVAIEAAMVRVRRRQTRRTMAPAVQQEFSPRLVGVLDAIEEGPSQTDPGETGVSVSQVAQRLAVDRSQASRLVSQAVEHKLVTRGAAQRDGRMSLLELTDKGDRVLTAVKLHRRERFASATSSWSARERAVFADLLTRFVAALDNQERRAEDDAPSA
jgi:DNA-binding MarR family transcriptional regulator